MKTLRSYCNQKGSYQDSTGQCVIELEEGDDADAIIKDYLKKRAWYEMSYSQPRRCKEYSFISWDGVKQVYEGDLIVFNTHREYLD